MGPFGHFFPFGIFGSHLGFLDPEVFRVDLQNPSKQGSGTFLSEEVRAPEDKNVARAGVGRTG